MAERILASKTKPVRKSAAVPTVNAARERQNERRQHIFKTNLDAQIFRIFQARAIVESVRAVLDEQEEGCDSWYALDVVQETLKEVAAALDGNTEGAAHV